MNVRRAKFLTDSWAVLLIDQKEPTVPDKQKGALMFHIPDPMKDAMEDGGP